MESQNFACLFPRSMMFFLNFKETSKNKSMNMKIKIYRNVENTGPSPRDGVDYERKLVTHIHFLTICGSSRFYV